MTAPNPYAEHFISQLKQYALFAEMLEHYLCRQQILAVQLAERLHVEAATISNWRKNKRLPDNLGLIHQMSVALALSPSEQENLVVAWCNTRMVRDLVPYVEEAMRVGDEENALHVAKTILGNFQR